MRNEDYEAGLKNSILQLKLLRAEEEILLRKQFFRTIDSFRPVNMIKSIFSEANPPVSVKDGMVNTAVGLTAGVISKIVFAGVMKSPLRKLIGNALMLGVTEIVARNPDAIQAAGKRVFNLLRRRSRG